MDTKKNWHRLAVRVKVDNSKHLKKHELNTPSPVFMTAPLIRGQVDHRKVQNVQGLNDHTLWITI